MRVFFKTKLQNIGAAIEILKVLSLENRPGVL